MKHLNLALYLFAAFAMTWYALGDDLTKTVYFGFVVVVLALPEPA